jgi:hypothetical protein
MQCLLTAKGKSMTHSNSVSGLDNIDDLPHPAAAIVRDPSASILPRPVSSQPNIADTGRISFGASMRIRSSK